MIETRLDVYQIKDRINFNLQVKNNHDFVITLVFSSAKKYEVIVKNKKGEVVYNSSKGKFFIQVFEEITIKENEQKNWNETWKVSQPLPGTYSVHAKIDPHDIKPVKVKTEQLQVSKTFEIK